MLFVFHPTVTGTWPIGVHVSDLAGEGLFQLVKQTPEVLALKLQAYLTSGITGESRNASLK